MCDVSVGYCLRGDEEGGMTFLPVLVRQWRAICSAATAGSSCSHTRNTSHPSAPRDSSLRASLALFCPSLRAHHSALAFGDAPCISHPCQKHPSTKTAILARVNAMSGRPGSSLRFTRNRSPRRCSSLRRDSSGFVPARFSLDMNVATAGEEAGGLSFRLAEGTR